MVATTAADIAVLVLGLGWLLLVLFLAVVLFKLSAVLENVKVLVNETRQESVPLLGDVRVTVQSVNRELERVDTMMESGGKIAKSSERIVGSVEQVVTSPLIKVAAATAGAAAFVRRFRGERE